MVEDTSTNSIRLRTGDMKNKRTFEIYDPSNKIEVTLWGNLADAAHLNKDDIICLRSVRVSEYDGRRTLSSIGNTSIMIDHK